MMRVGVPAVLMVGDESLSAPLGCGGRRGSIGCIRVSWVGMRSVRMGRWTVRTVSHWCDTWVGRCTSGSMHWVCLRMSRMRGRAWMNMRHAILGWRRSRSGCSISGSSRFDRWSTIVHSVIVILCNRGLCSCRICGNCRTRGKIVSRLRCCSCTICTIPDLIAIGQHGSRSTTGRSRVGGSRSTDRGWWRRVLVHWGWVMNLMLGV
jgi:hypothetical protein